MRNPYSIGSTEIDLRRELNNMFFGNGFELPKAHRGALRKMRRDSSNLLIPCSCVSDLTGEADRDIFCEFCHGEGYYWDEEWVDYRWVDIGSSLTKMSFKSLPMSPGVFDMDTKVFYLEHTVNITYYDRLIELKSDLEGDLIKPYQRYRIFKPQSIVPFRSDFGRIEYVAVFSSQKNAIFIEESYAK